MTPRTMTRGALAHLRVIDLTRLRSGPTCVRQFADWGADVIKIEQPKEGDDGLGNRGGGDFQNLHRNKRSLTLNLKDPRGLAILKQLVHTTDILVENYRPAVKQRLGIDYDTLAAENPRLIYASISGFGETGPYRDHAGFDQIAQGMGGLMWTTGHRGQGPLRAGTAVADSSAGLFAALGILIALAERTQSGRGQWVTTSLLAAMINVMDFQAARWLVDGEIPGQAGNDHPTSMPTSVYPTADGFVNIAASGNTIYARLCTALEAPELIHQPDFATADLRSAQRVALNDAISARTVTWSSGDLIAALNSAGVPCGPIYKMNEVFADRQVQYLALATDVPTPSGDTLALVAPAFTLSRTPAQLRRTIGPAGEHKDEILRALGLSDEEIATLSRDHVV
ncbi:MAG: CoA transferase [Gammaproteobacteria bacterium]|nr:CoA transferase [Gammaproteobacteria bacterium]